MKIIVMVYNAVSLGGFAYNALYTYEIFISNNAKRTQNVKSNPYYPFNIKANLNCYWQEILPTESSSFHGNVPVSFTLYGQFYVNCLCSCSHYIGDELASVMVS